MAGNKDAIDNAKLRFARQLYEKSQERYGTDHEETRRVLEYLTELERGDSRET
jgi:ribosomal protein S17E